MNIVRGETKTLNVTISADEVLKLPAAFNFIFTVKKTLDLDLFDNEAIIQKTYVFPGDFDVDLDGNYSVSVLLSIDDTTQPLGDYFYDFRILTNDKSFSKNTSGGTLSISTAPTQKQEVI